MADGGNGNNGLYFIVGGLVVVVGIGAFLVFGHPGGGGPTSKTTIERSTTFGSGDHSTTITKEKSSSD